MEGKGGLRKEAATGWKGRSVVLTRMRSEREEVGRGECHPRRLSLGCEEGREGEREAEEEEEDK
jgi:hypothetical protein